MTNEKYKSQIHQYRGEINNYGDATHLQIPTVVALTPGREGTLNCKLYWYPKFYKNALSFGRIKPLGAYVKSWFNNFYIKKGYFCLSSLGYVQL